MAADGALELRPLGPGDEAAFLVAHRNMAEHDAFVFGLGYVEGMAWAEYLKHRERARRGVDLAEGVVPSELLVAVVDGELAGRVSVRFELNAYLARQGGHIGYGVLRSYRRRGYAGALLRAGLAMLAERGVDHALLTCDDDNAGSATVIEHAGGRLDGVVNDDNTGTPIRRYWVSTGGRA